MAKAFQKSDIGGLAIRNVNQDKRIDFGFISQFGIGFLSSFQVAEKIVIKTRKANRPGLMITISGLRDYFEFLAGVVEEKRSTPRDAIAGKTKVLPSLNEMTPLR